MQTFVTYGQQVDSISGMTPEKNICRVVDNLLKSNPEDSAR
jgi:thioredoxin-like negative regulator of GroEL